MSKLKVSALKDLTGANGFMLAGGGITASTTLTVSNIVVNGEKKRLAGWKKTSKSDPSKTFLSLAVSEYQDQPDQKVAPQAPSNPVDDDLPF